MDKSKAALKKITLKKGIDTLFAGINFTNGSKKLIEKDVEAYIYP